MNSSIIKLFGIIIILAIFVSCKVLETNIIGTYNSMYYPKSILKIYSDKTFEYMNYTQNNNSELIDYDSGYYFFTKGTWTSSGNKQIILTSTNDTTIYELVNVKINQAKEINKSNFTFCDKFGDTVRILYVLYLNSKTAMTYGGSTVPYHIEDLTHSDDILEFHFQGHKAWKFINGKKQNADYNISFMPE